MKDIHIKDLHKDLQLIHHNNNYCLPKNSLPTKNTSPRISIIENNNFYEIYVSLHGLNQEKILLNYINNFLIIIFSIRSNHNKLISYKRSFYLKNIDINHTKNITCANLIHLKAPKIINSN